MPFYRLAYKGADNTEKPLPQSIPKRATQGARDDFAQSCGDQAFNQKSIVLKEVRFPDVNAPISEVDWSLFQNALEEEPALFNYPWRVFERRIKEHFMAAVLNEKNQAIATVNIIPKLTEQLRAVLGIPKTLERPPQVFETGAGWAHEDIRGQGIYTNLRQSLIDESKAAGRLIFSQNKGKGASSVNIRNKWTLVKWRDFPFASSLMGWALPEPPKNKFCTAAGKVIDIPEGGLYQGDTAGVSALTFNWMRTRDYSRQHHLWVSDIDKLRRFETYIRNGLAVRPDTSRELVGHSLAIWRQRVAENLFSDRDLLGDTPVIKEAWKEFSEGDQFVAALETRGANNAKGVPNYRGGADESVPVPASQ